MSDKKFHPGNWNVRPDYGKENVYHLWNADDMNFQDDTTPERMDANARAMSQVPKMHDIIKRVAQNPDVLKCLPAFLKQDIEALF